MTSEMPSNAPPDEFRAQRVAFAQGIRLITPTVISADEVWGEILGPYTEDQREVFFDVVAHYASVLRFGKAEDELVGPTGERRYTNLVDIVTKDRLVDAGMPDITVEMVETAADMLLGAKFSLGNELKEQEFEEPEEF